LKIDIDLLDERLFGNEMAQHEDLDVLYSYLVERNDLDEFYSERTRISILKAIKGSGKTALCLKALDKVKELSNTNIAFIKYDNEISPDIEDLNHTKWVKEWKRLIIKTVGVEIGKEIGFAFDDDAMSLVEEAEKGGFKKRSIVTAICDRIWSKDIPIEKRDANRQITDNLIERFTSGKGLIWLFLDEIDQFFTIEEKSLLRIATFFVACSELSRRIPEFRFRLTVRPNVWTVVISKYSALAGLRQYTVDLTWGIDQLRALLAKRVSSFCERNGKKIDHHFDSDEDRDLWLINSVFDPYRFDLGKGERPPHMALSTLSDHRPRWLIELCKASLKVALKNHHQRIDIQDVNNCLFDFGVHRMEDLNAEYTVQCDSLLTLMKSFANHKPLFKGWSELKVFIKNDILRKTSVIIAGYPQLIEPKHIAQFLFSVGFFQIRIDGDGEYSHITFDERNDYFLHEEMIRDDVAYEIHPIFRKTLFLDIFTRNDRKWGS